MQTLIIDYGSGNLRSAAKAVERMAPVTMNVVVSSKPEAVQKADYLILPGVGAFADCKQGLESVDGLRQTLEEAVQKRAKPFLGICVGMQLMARQGLEHGTHDGLNWLPGVVAPLTPKDKTLKIPHMGWNTLTVCNAGKNHPVLRNIRNEDHAYFVHSFHMVSDSPTDNAAWQLAHTDYGGPVTAIVGRDNLLGTQFHPEKSQQTGLRLLENFLQWRP